MRQIVMEASSKVNFWVAN